MGDLRSHAAAALSDVPAATEQCKSAGPRKVRHRSHAKCPPTPHLARAPGMSTATANSGVSDRIVSPRAKALSAIKQRPRPGSSRMHTPGGGGGGDHGSCELGEGGPEGSRRLFFCSKAAARNSEGARDMPTRGGARHSRHTFFKEEIRQNFIARARRVYQHVSFREAGASGCE